MKGPLMACNEKLVSPACNTCYSSLRTPTHAPTEAAAAGFLLLAATVPAPTSLRNPATQNTLGLLISYTGCPSELPAIGLSNPGIILLFGSAWQQCSPRVVTLRPLFFFFTSLSDAPWLAVCRRRRGLTEW